VLVHQLVPSTGDEVRQAVVGAQLREWRRA
jgi:hypothetical protein